LNFTKAKLTSGAIGFFVLKAEKFCSKDHKIPMYFLSQCGSGITIYKKDF